MLDDLIDTRQNSKAEKSNSKELKEIKCLYVPSSVM